MDIDGDGSDEYIVLYRNGLSAYGSSIKIYSGIKNLSEFDTKELKPWKLQSGYIRGENVIGVGVHTKSPLLEEIGNKIYLYSVDESGEFKPFFRSSASVDRLRDFILYDVNGDGASEIVTVEEGDEGEVVRVYENYGFGFFVDRIARDIRNVRFRGVDEINLRRDGVEKILSLDEFLNLKIWE